MWEKSVDIIVLCFSDKFKSKIAKKVYCRLMEILFEYFYIKCGSYLLMYSTQHQNRYIPLRDFYKTYPSSITLLREKSKPKSPNLDTVRDLDFNFSHKA